MALTSPPALFQDSFATQIDPGWLVVPRNGSVVQAGGALVISALAGADVSISNHQFPYCALLVGAGRDFYFQFTINSIAIVTSTNQAVFGVGTLNVANDAAGSLQGALAPIIEFGGATTGSPQTYFSFVAENEVGRRYSTAIPGASFMVRVMRLDNVMFAEYSLDAGTTWLAFASDIPARTVIRRFEVTEGSAVEGEMIAFYVRGSHPKDCAGVSASVDAVYATTWDRFSDPPTLGNLTARSWLSGGRIDLSWTNPPAGKDEVRSLTIVRSQLAPPELEPNDLVDEPQPSLEVDLTTPAPLWIPANATEWVARYPRVPVPTTLWRMVYEGSQTLLQLNGNIGSGNLQGNNANMAMSLTPGLNTGSMRALYAPELIDNATPPQFFNDNPDSFSNTGFNNIVVWIVFRIARMQVSGARTIVSSLDSATPANGWRIQLDAFGRVTWTTFGAGATATVTLPGNYGDGAWHAVLGVIDWASGNMFAWGDMDGATAATAMPATAPGSATQGLVLGAGLATGDLSASMQVAELAGWEGATAQNVRSAQALLMFTHGQVPFTPPNGITTTYTRASISAGEWGFVENDPGVPTRIAKYATVGALAAQFAFSFNQLYEHATLMDGQFTAVETNLVVDSEGVTNTTFTSAVGAMQAGPSPDGLHNAVQIAQTAVDGRAFWTITGLTANTFYWVSMYMMSGSAGHRANVWIRDSSDGTTIVNQNNVVYLQPYWRRYSFRVSTGAANTTLGIRVYGGQASVDTSKIALYYGRMVTIASNGNFAPDYIPSPLASSGNRQSALLTTQSVNGGAFVSAARGEMRVLFRRSVNSIGLTGSVALLDQASGAQNDLRAIQVSTTDTLVASASDSATAALTGIVTPVKAPATPIECRFDWRNDATLSGFANSRLAIFDDGVSDGSSQTTNFSAGAGTSRLTIGSTSGTPLRGGVAFVRLYNSTPACDGSLVPSGVGMDPLGLTVSTAVIGAASGVGTFSDVNVTPGRFYYYALFPSRAPNAPITFARPITSWQRLLIAPGDTDVGPASPGGNRVAGLALKDRVSTDGKYFYGEFPEVYHRADEADRAAQGRATGLLDDLSTFLQRGVDQVRGLTAGMHAVHDPEVGPLGLIGKPANQTDIVDAVLRERAVNPDAVGLLGTARRRLWGGSIGIFKRKGTAQAIDDYVTLITGWKATTISLPGTDFSLRFLRTWNGETDKLAVSTPVTGLTFGAGFVTIPSLALSPGKYNGGLFTDWFGNVKQIDHNTATTIFFTDTTFVPYAEVIYTGCVVTLTTNIVLPITPNDDQYNFGQVYETGQTAPQNITDTQSPISTVFASALTNSASTTVSIAPAYTGATYAARVPTYQCSLYDGESSHLYDPGSDLTLRGSAADPFFVLWPGLAPTGSGKSFPATDDDVIVWAPVGAARVANRQMLWVSTDGTSCVIAGWGPDIRPGDYLNPNRNQNQWFRIVGVHNLGTATYLSVTLINSTLAIDDVAALFDLSTVVSRQTLEHDRAVRALVPGISPLNSRCFVYYSE